MARRHLGWAAVAAWVAAAGASRAVTAAHPLAGAVLYDAAAAAAAAVATVGARRRRGAPRAAWLLVAAGLWSWIAGDVLWDWYTLTRGAQPDLSIADALYLAGYPLLALGLWRMVRLRSEHRAREGVLDGVALAIGAGLALWQYLVVPSITGLTGLALWVNAAYPLMDVLLLMALAWLAFAPGRRGWPTRLLFSGLVLTLALDIAYMVAPAAGPLGVDNINALYPLSYLLIALAAARSDAHELTDATVVAARPQHPMRLAFLGAALLTPPTVNLVEYLRARTRTVPVLLGATLAVATIVLLRFAGLVRDRERAQRELGHQASHDPLTGLVNRYLFADRIEHAIERAPRAEGEVAVLYLDLDRFKAVNDTLGHEAGDAVLVETAARVLAAVRSADTVARLGGDEFAVLCEDLEAAVTACEVAQRVVDALSEPFAIADSTVVVSASVGIAVHQTSDDTSESLLRDADAAMYRAKDRGRHRWELFDADMRAQLDERRQTEKALQQAAKHGELRLHYQPIVRVTDGTLVGFEALVRWQRPGIGLVPPEEFVALAEETGLIVPIGAWVLEHACFQLAQWRARHPDGPALHMSVNISSRQLGHARLARAVRRAVDRSLVDPSCLMLELTESMLVDNADWVRQELDAIKQLGARLAIDDFGTGYSGLSYLRDFPIDVVKIDQTFMREVGTEPGAARLVGAVITLAHALELEVIAEGVERDDQLDALRRLGCDGAQGYYFGRPLAAAEADDLVNQAQRPGRVALDQPGAA